MIRVTRQQARWRGLEPCFQILHGKGLSRGTCLCSSSTGYAFPPDKTHAVTPPRSSLHCKISLTEAGEPALHPQGQAELSGLPLGNTTHRLHHQPGQGPSLHYRLPGRGSRRSGGLAKKAAVLEGGRRPPGTQLYKLRPVILVPSTAVWEPWALLLEGSLPH